MIEHIIDKTYTGPKPDFKAGTMLLIDKPQEWTSFDCVNKVRGKLRYHLKDRKIKVGHAGTLDPMATGLLIICTGKYTKLIDSVQGQDKSYYAGLTLGATTPSYDAESEIDQHYPTDHIDPESLPATLASFLGPSEQIPPMFSAIKIKGQPLYKLARKGKTVERKPRPITIHDIALDKVDWPEVYFDVSCTKGTYIRTLAYDIGLAFDSGAFLHYLRRTAIGDYHVDRAITIHEMADQIDRWFEED